LTLGVLNFETEDFVKCRVNLVLLNTAFVSEVKRFIGSLQEGVSGKTKYR